MQWLHGRPSLWIFREVKKSLLPQSWERALAVCQPAGFLCCFFPLYSLCVGIQSTMSTWDVSLCASYFWWRPVNEPWPQVCLCPPFLPRVTFLPMLTEDQPLSRESKKNTLLSSSTIMTRGTMKHTRTLTDRWVSSSFYVTWCFDLVLVYRRKCFI